MVTGGFCLNWFYTLPWNILIIQYNLEIWSISLGVANNALDSYYCNGVNSSQSLLCWSGLRKEFKKGGNLRPPALQGNNIWKPPNLTFRPPADEEQ